MDPPINPLNALTFIVAPAILTNASSVMALGTSNRFARAVDRVRALTAQTKGIVEEADDERQLRLRQLRAAERRTLFLVRALTGFYTAVGCFGASALLSLIGAVFGIAEWQIPRDIALGLAMVAGLGGVGGLVTGTGMLIFESRMTLRILRDETLFRLSKMQP